MKSIVYEGITPRVLRTVFARAREFTQFGADTRDALASTVVSHPEPMATERYDSLNRLAHSLVLMVGLWLTIAVEN